MKKKKEKKEDEQENKKKFIIQLVILILLLLTFMGIVLHYILKTSHVPTPQPEEIIVDTTAEQPIISSGQPTTTKQIIGTSVEGRAIESYSYGNGTTTILFVGGIHGGYEWNSVLLAYKLIDELEADLIKIPEGINVEIIPVLNPDGLYAVIGKEGRFALEDIPEKSTLLNGQGRFNANDVDLNRNFDCKWKPSSSWRGEVVSAGSSAFSEPEAEALKKIVEEKNPKAVVFWHSQANAVYASECEEGILPETLALMSSYAQSANYKAVESFDAYPITGDAEGWLASIGIPAITVELSNHEDIEWEKNVAGVQSVLNLYSEPLGR